jgi:hypothetical protein
MFSSLKANVASLWRSDANASPNTTAEVPNRQKPAIKVVPPKKPTTVWFDNEATDPGAEQHRVTAAPDLASRGFVTEELKEEQSSEDDDEAVLSPSGVHAQPPLEPDEAKADQ